MDLSHEEVQVALNALVTYTINHMSFNSVTPELAELISKLRAEVAERVAVEEAPVEAAVEEVPAEEAPAE